MWSSVPFDDAPRIAHARAGMPLGDVDAWTMIRASEGRRQNRRSPLCATDDDDGWRPFSI